MDDGDLNDQPIAILPENNCSAYYLNSEDRDYRVHDSSLVIFFEVEMFINISKFFFYLRLFKSVIELAQEDDVEDPIANDQREKHKRDPIAAV